jgi:RNA polymerase sigma factor (sigma-70 family)
VPEQGESAVPASESRIDLQGELQKLAPRERACLVLRYYEDLKVDDIATALGISSGAVKRYLSDGLARMAVALDEMDSTRHEGASDVQRI